MIRISSDQFCLYPLAKMFFVFWYSDMIINFELRIFFVRIFIVFSIRIICNVNGFTFMVLWTLLLYLLTISSDISCDINILWNGCHVLKNLVFESSNKLFSNNRFSFIVCWIHFSAIYFQKPLKKLIVKFTTLINPYFIWFASFWDYFLECINHSNSSFVF